MAELACAFFGRPAKELTLVGLTGTNGKTTTMYILEAVLEAAGRPTGTIGTISYRYGGNVQDAPTTTPQSLHLQGMLREMVDGGMTHGDHGSDVPRAGPAPRPGMPFFGRRVYEHHTGPFGLPWRHGKIPGRQDEAFRTLSGPRRTRRKGRAECGGPRLPSPSQKNPSDDPSAFGTESNCDPKTADFPAPDFLAKDIALTRDGLRFRLRYPDGEVEIETALIGEPNVMNVLAAWRVRLVARNCS